MSWDAQNDQGSIRSGFLQVVRDFSDYLSVQKRSGNSSIRVSKSSEALMNNWGRPLPVRPPFFFEGPETASFFIIDSGEKFYKGKSGALLKKILNAMKVDPNDVFICNTGDDPSIHRKIKAIAPKIIITLGTKASQNLLNIQQPLEQLRGKFHDVNGIQVMPTFHPSLLLRYPEFKRQVWEDMKQVMAATGIKYDS